MDVVWSVLVLMGIEKLPGFTEANALDLYYMPYKHSLPGSIVLFLIFGAIVAPVCLRQSRNNHTSRCSGVIFPLDP
jgi:hypothetical protein